MTQVPRRRPVHELHLTDQLGQNPRRRRCDRPVEGVDGGHMRIRSGSSSSASARNWASVKPVPTRPISSLVVTGARQPQQQRPWCRRGCATRSPAADHYLDVVPVLSVVCATASTVVPAGRRECAASGDNTFVVVFAAVVMASAPEPSTSSAGTSCMSDFQNSGASSSRVADAV